MFLSKPSFAAGELSPSLYGRTDLNKYDVGAAELLNFIVLRYGGVKRRPGLRHIARLNTIARQIPFSYSKEDSYVIVVTPGMFYFVQNTELMPFSTANDYRADEIFDIKYTQSADVMFLTHPNHPPATLTRKADATWTYSIMDISAGPFEDANVSDTKIRANGVVGDVRLTATENFFTEDMVGQLLRIGHTMKSQYVKYDKTVKKVKDHIVLTDGPSFVLEINNVDDLTFDKFTVIDDMSGGNVTSHFTFNSSTKTLSCDESYFLLNFGRQKTYTVTLEYSGNFFDSDVVIVPPQGTISVETFGFWTGTIELQKYDDDTGSWVEVRSQTNNHTSNYSFTEKNEGTTIREYRIYSSDFDNSTWSGENAKQKGYVVLQCYAQGHYGIVKITNVINGTTAEATVQRRLAEKTATKDFAVQAWAPTKGYPTCVGFYEDHLVFAGSKKQPQTYWFSKTGDYYNYDVSTPQQADDAITGTLNNGQMNGIKAMVAFGELLLLTAGGEYKLSGGNEAITPSNQQAKAQEYRGINNLSPVVCGSRVIYVQSMGSIVRDFAYAYDQDKYTGDDISLLASHLFEGHTIVSIAYQQTPNSIVWCVRDDGVLLGMTYIKEQDVYAWHKHTTEGRFVDVCSIASENEDRVYFIVERNCEYYIERMASQIDNDNEATQYFMDSYSYAENTDHVDGLDRLEGQEVAILADGNVMPMQVVKNGSIQLGHNFNLAIVGLPFTSVLKTLPIEFNGDDGTYQSRKKRLSKLMIYFQNSRGGLYGINENKLDEIKWRSNENYNAAIELYSGKKYIVPPSGWTDTLQLVVRQYEPLPLSILSVVPEIQAGG